MPHVAVNDIQMYYEVLGQGEPLVLIMGLAWDNTMFHRVIPALSQHFQTVVFDNRGAGQTEKPRSRYSISLFAEDTICLMDRLGIESAHVLGLSMGGFIAQEVAFRVPQRVRSLVLGCTSCGGPRAALAAPDVLFALTMMGMMGRRGVIEKSIPLLYTQKTRVLYPERIQEDVQIMMRYPQPGHAFANQVSAIMGFDSYDGLPRIAAPTLIVHGDDDVLVPPANARILHSRIPGAALALLANAGHVFSTDQPEKSRQVLLDFLLRQRKAP